LNTDAITAIPFPMSISLSERRSIPDVDFPERTSEPPMELQLGGRIYRVTSFGDLLTSIIYPDHVVSPKFTAALESAGKDPDSIRMLNFTDEMTLTWWSFLTVNTRVYSEGNTRPKNRDQADACGI
jgi:hypothetical protein